MTLVTVCDVLGAVLGITGMVFVIRKKRVGFLLWIGSNGFLITAFAIKGLYGTIGMFIVYTGFNIVGFIAWSKKGKAWLKKQTERLKQLIRK